MKGLGKRIFGLCADTFGLNKRIQGPQALVLRLHRVVPESVLEKLRFQRQHALSEEGLDHLLTLLQRKYTLIQLDEYLAMEPRLIPRRERFACITLDDGWQDNFIYAFPLLKTHRIPASIFLATGYVDSDKPFWWQTLGDAFVETLHHPDKDTLFKAQIAALTPDAPEFEDVDAFMAFAYTLSHEQRDTLAMALAPLCESPASIGLNWEQIRLMSDSGLVRFGAQSRSHLPLTLLSQAAAQSEIGESFSLLAEHSQVKFNRLFCYPQGAYSDDIMAMTAAAGFTGAVCNFPCYASRQVRERYRLPRLNITEALARDPSLFNYRLLKAGTKRGRLLSTTKPAPAPQTT